MTRRLKRTRASQYAAAAALAWILACLAWAGLAILRYRRDLPLACPPLSDYVVFCRAHQADELLASLLRCGLVFAIGAILVGVVALVLGVVTGSPRLGEAEPR